MNGRSMGGDRNFFVFDPFCFSFGTQDAKDALLLVFNEQMAAGLIVAGILSVLGAVVCLFKGTIAKKIG